MQLLCHVAFLLLCSLPFLSSVFPLDCSSTQYPWPVVESKLCCEMCPPGHHMNPRQHNNSCTRVCVSCEGERYIDTYNVALTCSNCKLCEHPNMEYKSRCSFTQNAECRCKTGYNCKDKPCTRCVPTPTLPPATTTPHCTMATCCSTQGRHCNHSNTLHGCLRVLTMPLSFILTEKAWFLVIIALLCIGIALVVVTKIKPLLRWIRSKDSFFFTDKPEQSYSEDDDQSKPVQEVCGECDQPIDVCLKC
ncbi:tumor necrosis factor receptor superfamily member 6 [Hippoglossus hippoglossus]|uniref:tumor necrosis factor receptor superfamily member 6 n=1 Tax=Hippoglossus hippoglossus TaxID=8267 RepID=UPI00148C566F|nr:tumor necrosis factor receptor superfamily member 6 [Hippoglossus hippoglossus]